MRLYVVVNVVCLDGLPHHVAQLLDCVLVAWQSVTLGVVKEVCRVRIADVEEGQGAVDVGVQGADCVLQLAFSPSKKSWGLTDVAGGNLNHNVGLVAENHGVRVRVDWGPPSEEDGVLEHGLDALLLESALLVEQKGPCHRGALGVANDSVKGAALFHDFEEVFEGVGGALVRRGDSLPHQLPHRVLGRLAVGEVSDPGQDVVVLGLLDILVGLDEAVVGGLAKVLFEALGWDSCAGPIDEVKGGRRVLGELFDDGCWLGVGTHFKEYEVPERVSYPVGLGISSPLLARARGLYLYRKKR